MIPTDRHRHASARRSEPVRLEEAPDRLGDLLVALLADDQAVVGVRPERLVLRAEPLGEPLRRRLRARSDRGRRR